MAHRLPTLRSAKGRVRRDRPVTTRRDAHTATLLPNGKVLVAGGEEVNDSGFSVLLASAELYDPSSGLFSLTGSMVTGRELHTATMMSNGKV